MTDEFLPRPSTVTLEKVAPNGVVTLIDYFVWRFPRVAPAVWAERFAAGKVWTGQGILAANHDFVPGLVAHYRREVATEPEVRTDWRIVWQDDDLLVVDKPPFLPVTPGGLWVRGCLLHLLCEQLREAELAPLHRLDRLTSGLVMLSRRRCSRSHVSRLFQGARSVLEKHYTAVVEIGDRSPPQSLDLADHVTRSSTDYWRQMVVRGRPSNAYCRLELIMEDGDLAVYSVIAATGRKHQLRVQLANAGLPIVNDPLYGSEPRRDPSDLRRRLGLDARYLGITGFTTWSGEGFDQHWWSDRDPEALVDEVRRSS